MSNFDFPEFEMPMVEFSNEDNESSDEEKVFKNTNKELNEEDFQQFDHICPKCKFEFNDKN